MKIPKISKKKTLIVLGVSLLFTISAVSSYLFFSLKGVFVKSEETVSPSVVEDVPVDLFGNFINVLLLGYGGVGHEGGSLMDSIILLSFDTEAKRAVLVSIPRDLWVSIPTDYDKATNYKINEAYSIGLDNLRFPNKKPEFKGDLGGWTLMKYAAGVVTGITPQYFIGVDFGGFKKAIDLLGGVDVEIPKAYDDYFYPVKGKELETCAKTGEEIAQLHQKYSGFELEKQFECRYEHIHFDKGIGKMDGETALKYTRSRHGDGDFGRSQRQFAVLGAIKNKAVSVGAVPKAGKLFETLLATVKTDMPSSAIKSFLTLIGNPNDYKIVSVHLTEDNVLSAGSGPSGQFILLPKDGANNWTRVRAFIATSFSSL